MNEQKRPALSSRRPGVDTKSALDKLSALDGWSEQPAVTASNALEDVKIQKTPNDPPKAEKPVRALKKEVEEGVKAAKLPWDDASDRLTINFMLRPSETLHAKLKYLGETTYGSSMHKIAIEAVEHAVEKMLKERGIK